MPSAWFETVAEAQRRARRRLPKSVYAALIAGSEAGVTLSDNSAAFRELGFAPHVADLPAVRDTAAEVMGQPLALPVIISPTGVQAIDPDGEVAVARAACARGTAIGLSSFASKPIEEVIAANPQTFFQIYWSGSRGQIVQRLERARAAGAVGAIVTLDWTFSHRRDWGSPEIPERMSVEAMLKLLPEAVIRPGWFLRWTRAGGPPDLTVPEHGGRRTAGADVLRSLWRVDADSAPELGGPAWLREQWDGPIMLKGVIRVDDALRAADAGVTAISVSNHGGNNLDGTPGGDPGAAGRSPKRSASRSRSCSTAGSAVAATWSRPSRSAPARS